MSEISNLEVDYPSIIEVNSTDRVVSSTSSKGNQIKWCINDIWLKADDLGYEGLAESVASAVLKQSNIKDFVDYKCVRIKEVDTERVYRGCISKSFLYDDTEKLITLYRLFTTHGINLDISLANLSTEQRLQYVIEKTIEFTKIKEFGSWLGLLLEFDAFILNEDRHFHNIAVIKKDDDYRCMPIFDCGAGLLSDTHMDYPLSMSVTSCINRVSSKPFNTKFSKQLKAVENVCGLHLKLSDIKEFSSKIYSKEEVQRVNKVLRIMLERKNVKNNITNNCTNLNIF